MNRSGLSLFTRHPVEKGSDSPVSAGRAVAGNHPDKGTLYSIVRMGASPPGSCRLFVSAIHAGVGGTGIRTISFSSRAISMASFKISTSMVFLLRIRSGSQTLVFSSLTSGRGTTASSTIARFCAALHRLLLLTDVMTSTGLIGLLSLIIGITHGYYYNLFWLYECPV